MEILIIIILWFLFFKREHKEIWKWAQADGFDIQKSDFLPKGHSPSDLISKKEWDRIKPISPTLKE